MSIIELGNIAQQYREIQADINSMKEQAESLKLQMISEMDARQTDALPAGGHTIRYTVYESTRANTAKLKADGLYEQYSTTSTAVRFSIT